MNTYFFSSRQYQYCRTCWRVESLIVHYCKNASKNTWLPPFTPPCVSSYTNSLDIYQIQFLEIYLQFQKFPRDVQWTSKTNTRVTFITQWMIASMFPYIFRNTYLAWALNPLPLSLPLLGDAPAQAFCDTFTFCFL